MFVRSNQQIKEKDFRYKAVKLYEDNEYWYVILLKGLWWTVMDDVAEGAHQGMTVQMEHTTCKDPLTDEAAVVSELLFYSLVFSCIWIVWLYVPHMQLQ